MIQWFVRIARTMLIVATAVSRFVLQPWPENIRVGVDLFSEWFVMADDNDAMAEVFQFFALALVLFLSGRLVVGGAVNEDSYTLQAVPLVEEVCLGINAGFGAVLCPVGKTPAAVE